MFREVNDFLNQWDEESKSTLKIFNLIPDSESNNKSLMYSRSLLNLAWHITESLNMLNSTGFNIGDDKTHTDPPQNMKSIIEHYSKLSESLVEIVRTWKNEDLLIEDNNYGEMWKRGFTLFALITHQAHHRAQMTVLMRQLGLLVPGVYGPSKEEWALYGMEEPKI